MTIEIRGKWAMDKYTRDLAIELEGSGVLANLADPGWCRTDMGGPDAFNNVTSVLPGILIPAMLGKEDLKRPREYFLQPRFLPGSSGARPIEGQTDA